MAKSAPEGPRNRVFILDTSAVLEGAWSTHAEGCIAPPAVAAEFSPGGRTWAQWQRLLAAGLKVRPPAGEALEQAREEAQRLGETRLSPGDLELIALALQTRSDAEEAEQGPHGVVVTDDYAVQNVLSHLGLPWQGARAPGIQERRSYRLRCSGCGRWFDPDASHQEGGECSVCGSPLRRRRHST